MKLRTWLLIGFVVAVACGRMAVVFRAGSPVPFNDQWYAEGQSLFLPLAHGQLSPAALLQPNNEHLIVGTKLIALGLLALEERWDPIAQMLVNCLLAPAGFALLLRWVLPRLSDAAGAVLVMASACLLGSPLFYGNTIWGFQSQVLLMLACSMLHLHLFANGRDGWRNWLGGALTGLAAAACFGSGAVAAALTAVAAAGGWPKIKRNAPVRLAWVVSGAATVGLASALTPHWEIGAKCHLDATVRTFVHALSFPDRYFSWWGLLFWSPAVIAAGLAIRRHDRASEMLFPLVVAAWGLCQAACIAIGRASAALVLAPRYYDILAVGVLANLLLAIGLVAAAHGRGFRLAARGLLAFWMAVAGYKAGAFALSHARGDVPVLEQIALRQVQLIHQFYADAGGPEELRRARMPERPLADTALLESLLREPAIRRLWPAEWVSAKRPSALLELTWLGHRRMIWYRGALVVAFATLAGLMAIAVRAVARLRGGPPDEMPDSSGRSVRRETDLVAQARERCQTPARAVPGG